MFLSKKATTKVGVFYDGNFLLHTSNYYNYIHPQKRRLSIGGIHRFLRNYISSFDQINESFCQIVEAHYFRGRLNAAEASQRGNQLYNDRVFDDILMSEGVQTHYLPLRNLFGRKEERGVDVWLSLEAYELSIVRDLDIVVLVASDTDYVPLVRKLIGRGVRVFLMSWEFEYTNEDGNRIVTRTSHDLINVATVTLPMHSIIEEAFAAKDPEINSMFVSEGRNVPAPTKKERSDILSLKNGYGFIRYPNNNLFFHYQNVIGDFTDLKVGDTVEFTIDKNSEGQDIAKCVMKVDSAASDLDEFDGWDSDTILKDINKR
ncbi:MAG: NYN domain-containing protein [Rikenellaceae bacterium]|nr:NYN domain-containing protein [Rikenellaceae bacterium]MDE7355535.1 NYN domain-containing protein [Rikenellaceae bacterium]